MKCDQPESHARIAVFGRPDGSLSDIRNGRTCQYGMKHDEPTTPLPPEVFPIVADPAETSTTSATPPAEGDRP